MNLPALLKRGRTAYCAESEANAEWLQHNMSPYFFQAMTDAEDAMMLLAREMTTLTHNRRLILADRDKLLVIACVNVAGSIYDTLRHIGEHEISYAMFSHSNKSMPGMTQELEVQRFEFDRRKHHEIDPQQKLTIPANLVRGVRAELLRSFPDFDCKKLDQHLKLLWLNNENYIRMSPVTRIAWLVWLFERGNSSGGLFLDIAAPEHRDQLETRVLLAVGNPPQTDFLLQILEVFNRLDIGIRRAYCQTISNGTHPYFLGAFFVTNRQGQALHPDSDLAQQLSRELCITQILAIASPAYRNLVTQRLMSGEDATLVNAFISFCHTSLAHSQPERFGLDDVQKAFYDHPEISQMMVNLFRIRFDPGLDHREQIYQSTLNDSQRAIESYNTGHRWLDEIRRTIYRICLLFITHTLKTNFFIDQKQALAFRLDPAYVRELGNEFTAALPEALPFRITFFFSRFGSGYHIGFSDIARGGWRTVIARSADDVTITSNTIFREVYVLAHTQHLKNKDIYEGGSKMALVLDVSDIDRYDVEEEVCRLYKLQYSTANAFLDIFVTEKGHAKDVRVVDYYRDDEPIEIGPDENMHDGMIEAIAKLSRKRGYILGIGIMSSKRIGINHKEYGVTSTGVVTFAAITMAHVMSRDIYSEQFSLKMTGGTNGDVAGNCLRIMLQRCPAMQVRLILDGTAALYDPSGINRHALEKIVLQHDLDAFDPQYLNIGGYIIYRTGRKMEGLRELHRKISRTESGLQEEWLEIDDFYNQYNSLIFSVQTDVFIPAGGRPETIDSQNWKAFINNNGLPSANVIIEGANSFITPEARLLLQQSGVVIMRDASANKCGVISSSYEIIANLLLTEAEFLEHKDEYVQNVVSILQKRAADEAHLILQRYEASSKTVYCTRISDAISVEINNHYARLFSFFEDHPDLRLKSPFIQAIYRHLPQLLVDNRKLRSRIRRLPGKYLSAILAAEIGSSLVYTDTGAADFEAMIRRHLAQAVTHSAVTDG